MQMCICVDTWYLTLIKCFGDTLQQSKGRRPFARGRGIFGQLIARLVNVPHLQPAYTRGSIVTHNALDVGDACRAPRAQATTTI